MNRTLNKLSVVGMFLLLVSLVFWIQKLTIGQIPEIKNEKISNIFFALFSILVVLALFKIRKPHPELPKGKDNRNLQSDKNIYKIKHAHK